MKLMWFHLMPYTELPDDFRDKHPSVWVDIHSSLFDPRRAHHMYNDFMDELEFAAECGFDAVCVNEHHSNGYGLMPSPNLIASALARRTTDAALCVMGNSLSLNNPPTRVGRAARQCRGDQIGRGHQPVAVRVVLIDAHRVEAALGSEFELVHEVVVHVMGAPRVEQRGMNVDPHRGVLVPKIVGQ